MFSFFRKDPGNLLRSATAHREAGKMAEAINDLKEAYRAIAKGNGEYPVETYVRLPLYLQEAKRENEAWIEFKNLLSNGYHRMSKDPILVPMFHATMYDKMRLFLQRQGNPLLACAYGVGAHYSTALGLCRQKRADELLTLLDAATERELVTKLLKKAKALDRIDAVLATTLQYRENISSVDPAHVIHDVSVTLQVSPEYCPQG